MAKWFIEKAGQEIGPLSTGQLRQKAVAGELVPTDKVRKDDMPQWARAGTVKGLFDVIIPPLVHAPAEAPPPVPEGNVSPFDFFGHSASSDPTESSVLESRPEFDFFGDQSTSVQPLPPEVMTSPATSTIRSDITSVAITKRGKKPRPGDDVVPIAQPAPDVDAMSGLTPVAGAIAEIAGEAVEISKNVAHLTGGATILSMAEQWILARTLYKGTVTEIYLPLARVDSVCLSDAALPGGPWKVLTLSAGRTIVAVAFAGNGAEVRAFAEKALARVGMRKVS